MNRSDLVQQLASQFPQLTPHDVESAVTAILEAMTNAMADAHRIELRGFGSFSTMHRAPRVGRNPRNGDPVAIPAKRLPHFKPGKALREAVDLHTNT